MGLIYLNHFKQYILVLASAAVIIICSIQILHYNLFTIPTSSMENTLLPGDVILVKNIKTVGRTFLKEKDDQISRGDILVVIETASNRTAYIVKRCIGLPGDRLSIYFDSVFINGVYSQPRGSYKYIWRFPIDDLKKLKASSIEGTIDILQESKSEIFILKTISDVEAIKLHNPEIKLDKHFLGSPSDSNGLSFMKNITIPCHGPISESFLTQNYDYGHLFNANENGDSIIKYNYYFLLGDNRHLSVDSRKTGVIPEYLIVGKAWLILFSKGKEHNNEKTLRYSRFLKRID